MKRTIVTILAMLALISLSSCNSIPGSEPKEKSKQEIIADLSNCADFWSYVAPGQSSDITAEYTVKDIDIQSREKDQNYDTIIGNVTAESSYATYAGTFLVKYLFQEDSGYSLYTVYQEVPGTYSNIKLPDSSFAESYYKANGANIFSMPGYSEPVFQEISVEPIDGREDACVLHVKCTLRDDFLHCTNSANVSCMAHFKNGTWEVGSIYDALLEQKEDITYDQVNQIYYEAELGYSNRVVLTNAYVLDGIQYYDQFSYCSEAELNYADEITYGFWKTEKRVSVTDCYIGRDSILCESTGPIDEQGALSYLEQIKEQDDSLFIITDPEAYIATLPANIDDPGYIIIGEQYVNDDGLNVAIIVRRGTYGYEMATNN